MVRLFAFSFPDLPPGLIPFRDNEGKPRSIDDLEKLAKAEALKGISESKSKDLSLRYKHHGSVFDLAQEQTARSHVPPLSSMSYNSWVGCGEGTYVLELMGNGSMKVVKTKAVGDNPRKSLSFPSLPPALRPFLPPCH